MGADLRGAGAVEREAWAGGEVNQRVYGPISLSKAQQRKLHNGGPQENLSDLSKSKFNKALKGSGEKPPIAPARVIMKDGKVLMPSRFNEIRSATPPQYQQQCERSGLLPETRES